MQLFSHSHASASCLFAAWLTARSTAAGAVNLDNVERMMQGLEPEDGDETVDDDTINNSETDEVEGDQGY